MNRKQQLRFVPKDKVKTVLCAWHDQRGHPGAQKTLEGVRERDQVSNDPSEKGEPGQRPELEENMQVDLDEQGQPLAQCVDAEAARKEHRGLMKALARERRGEVEEDARRSTRPNEGIPPLKYLMDLIGKWTALRKKTESRVQNWARFHVLSKREAVLRVAPFYS